MKKIRIWLLAVIVIMIFTGCTSPSSQPAATPSNDEIQKEFTVEEVAAFDGKDGNLAYIIVDQVVYDVSDVKVWKNGLHQNKFVAGKDYTKEIKSLSPHGSSVLKNIPIVGTIK